MAMGYLQLVVTMVHSAPIDWMLPGVAPTGKTISIPLVAIVRFAEQDEEWRLVHGAHLGTRFRGVPLTGMWWRWMDRTVLYCPA
jgi:hypothetical protein